MGKTVKSSLGTEGSQANVDVMDRHRKDKAPSGLNARTCRERDVRWCLPLSQSGEFDSQAGPRVVEMDEVDMLIRLELVQQLLDAHALDVVLVGHDERFGLSGHRENRTVLDAHDSH